MEGPRILTKLQAHVNNIALSHSVFALPFAYMGAFLAAGGRPGWAELGWITLAMVGARSAALALNNLIDLKYDKMHPRFTARPMVKGTIKPWEALAFILVSLSVFLWAAAQLHPICLLLSPLAILPFLLYPYMKRFSWTCHLVLGVALACAPVGAWLAIRGDLAWPVLILGGSVAAWIAAFDVIYGCQDTAFDQEHSLHSIPVRFGIPGALRISRWMHGLSILGLITVGLLLNLNGYYYLGVGLAAVVLCYQHHIVRPWDLSRVTQVYFMRNGLVSIVMFLFTLLSL